MEQSQGTFQDIGRCALDRHIFGKTLCGADARTIILINREFRQPAALSAGLPLGNDVPRLAAKPIVHSRVRRKVLAERILSLGLRQAGHGRKSRRPDAVNDPEIEPLGKRTLIRRHIGGVDPENLCRRRRVKVLTGLEGVDEFLIFGKIGEDPQFDL